MSQAQERSEVIDRIQGPELSQAFQDAIQNEGVRRELAEDPRGFLKLRGVYTPDDAEVNLVLPHPLPDPELDAYSFHLSNCIRYREPIKMDGKIIGYRFHQVCFGIEIVPTTVPGGPRG
jgi:hypothetical protein